MPLLKKSLLFFLILIVIFAWSELLFSEYTLVLKTGRRITVQSYREEGGMIKFYGFGGEISIAKQEIQSIVKAGEEEARGTFVGGAEAPSAADAPSETAEAGKEEKKADGPSAPEESKPEEKSDQVAEKAPAQAKEPAQPPEKVLSPEEQLAAEKEKEEKEYQGKLREIIAQLKATRESYVAASRGTGGSEPIIATTEEQIKARTEMLMSRLRDAQHQSAAARDTVDAPATGYSDKEREVSALRERITQLEGERDRLIEEMRAKGLDTGGLFLD